MPSASKARVLIVDDLPAKHLVYRAILDNPEFELVSVRSGPEALRALLDQEFAVVLLDVNMPDMDGFETARMIRARKKCAHTPIIFVTAHADELHAVRGYAYGAVDYMLAPIVPEVLRTKVGVFAELYRREQQITRQARDRVAHAEVQRAYLAETLEATTDFVARFDIEGRVQYMNRAGRDLLGLAPDAAISLAGCMPPWAYEVLMSEGVRAAHERGTWSRESALLRVDGTEVPVSQVVVVHRDPAGRVEFYTTIARDITDAKRAAEELAVHRRGLESLVQQRTAELEASNRRLRLADRMAAVGTLAAGLGHDMGNLLMPIRLRLDVLEGAGLPAASAEDVAAIRKASDYLQRMTRGLRLFALDPASAAGLDESTRLPAWWEEVSPFLRNAVPKGVPVEARIDSGLPAVAIPPHRFTQAVYNLVQNAGEACRDTQGGWVRVTASLAPGAGGRNILVGVHDNGAGMTAEVRRRCFEPFYTTKSRGLSTGLGLALVHAAVAQCGGSVEITSEPGRGTSFLLTLPSRPAGPARGSTPPATRRGVVQVKDARVRAYITSVLRNHGVEVRAMGNDPDLAVAVMEGATCAERAAEFLSGAPGRAAILYGVASGPPGAVTVPERASPAAIREAVRTALGAQGEQTNEAGHPAAVCG
ncbi:MAG: response regulator [Phycisphaerales bacterium]|nr:response regulator [Phycisphaerales bacterium]